MQVTIKYTGPVADVVRVGMPICGVFVPRSSYIDSPVYTEGYKDAEGTEKYGKSIYATNVWERGTLPGLLPMAHTTTKFAQFELAVLAAAEATAEGTENKGIKFTFEDDYKEELYWNQISKNMAPLGFYITVGENTYGVDMETGEGAEGTGGTEGGEDSNTEGD